jgi:hypothetical protein
MGKKMNSDSYFEIGSTHLVCQDYALHGQFDDLTYAIVSDGCSEAPNSEIGAQILCHVAQYYIKLFYHTGVLAECSMDTLASLFANSVLTRADEIRKLYPIDKGALQATLLMAINFEKSSNVPITRVFSWGDGFIIEKHDKMDGRTIIHETHFPSGAPIYLVTDQIGYAQEIGEIEVINKVHLIKNGKQSTDEITNNVYVGFYKEYYPIDHLEVLTLCSDGLKSYQDVDHKAVDFFVMAQQFTDYRSNNGVFVQRCMNFMKIANKKLQRTHYDDVSTAAILV